MFRRLILTLLACLSLSFTNPRQMVHPGIAEMAWDDACRLTSYSCEDLSQPLVVGEALWERFGVLARGLFTPVEAPNVVWLDVTLTRRMQGPQVPLRDYATLVHEYVHYIDWHVSGQDWPDLEWVCASESLAWGVSNRLMLEHDAPEMALWTWREHYPYCSTKNQ